MLLRDLFEGIVGTAEGLEHALAPQVAEQPIAKVVVDSRAVEPNAVFVGLPGEQTDGSLYVGDALAAGAVAAIAGEKALELDFVATFLGPDGRVLRGPELATGGQSWVPVVFVVPDAMASLQQWAGYWRARMPVVVTGITGSVGKTTTKESVASVLGVRFKTLRNQGNLNNEIGLPLTLLELEPTHERAVLEMGMYDVGEIDRLCQIARPLIGVVTNIGPAHLERLRSIERIAQAKAELVQALPPADAGGVAILNADEPLVMAMARHTQARVFTYGLDPSANLWAGGIVSEGIEGIGFQMHYEDSVLHVHLDMLGRHSVHTALRGAAVGLVQGLSWAEIVTGLQADRGNLRLMVVPGPEGTTLVDDTYNASPASMLAALNLLQDIANSNHRPVAVLGDMLELGPYELEGHQVVGGRAAQVVSKLITVGQRARWIAEAAVASGMNNEDVYLATGNDEAVALLRQVVQTGDIILVKGSRGQKMEGIVDALSRARETES